MEGKRPKIKIPMSPLNLVVEILCLLFIAATIILAVTTFGKLPETIPSHFNAAGEIDGYGSRATIFFLLPVIFIMYAGLTALGRVPHIYNYAVEITSENAERQYKLAKTFISVLKLEIVTMFCYMEYSIINSALNTRFTLGMWFLPAVLIIVFGSIGFYIHKSVKAEKNN